MQTAPKWGSARLNEDRQVGPLKLIDEGHKARYRFAATRVSGKVLDIACGCGYGSHMMHHNCSVVGVDIEPEAIAYADENYSGPDFRIGRADEIHGSFDWIVSLETIEHVHEPESVLAAFRKQGDNLIISSPNQDHYKFKAEKYHGAKYPHLRHYTPDEFESLLNHAGWTVVEKWGQTKKRSEVSHETGVFMVWICK